MSKHSERVGERVRIYRRGELYSATMQHRGRQHRRSLKTSNIKTARRLALAWEAEVLSASNSSTAQLEPPTVSEVVEFLLDVCEAEGRAVRTMTQYRRVLRGIGKIADELNLRDILEINLTFVDHYRQRRRRAGMSPKTIHNEVVLIRQLVKFARTRQLIQFDPLEGLKNSEPKGKPQPFWTHEQLQSILAAAREPQRTIFTFLSETGVRIGEAQWLTWEDIDGANGVIHIRSKPGWTTKTGNARAIPMTPIVSRLLQSLPRHKPWVFTAPPSARYPDGDHQISERRLLQSLKRTLAILNLPGHLHTFRHSFISRAICKGVPEAVVRSWVGHVDADTIRMYTHIASPQSQQAMLQLHNTLWSTAPEK